MESARKLEIVQSRFVDFFSHYKWIVVYIYLLLLPFLIVLMNTVHLHGEDTQRLQHDIDTAMLQPVPVPSMWVDYQPLKNGSTYVPVGLTREGMFETFLLLFPWNLQITAVLQVLLNSLFPSVIMHALVLESSLKHYTKWRTVMFLALATLYSLLLYSAIDGTLTLAYISVGDSFLAWIESHIVTLYLDDYHSDITTSHPFTLGNYPPYLLTKYYRYIREDVEFQCEYNVTSDLDIDPGHVTTWWRKNGLPVEANDRIYVNVTIDNIPYDNLFPEDFKLYLIRSTLTIEIIQHSDYGSYTCDYVNSLPGHVRVKNYFPRNDPNYQPVETPQPMTPNPKCSCQPTFQEHPEDHSLSARTICFSEFILIPIAPATKTVQISPGGILVTAASYRTAASMSDIKVDVTFEGNSDRKGNSECCSLFIKIYWALFRVGNFVDLPISRLLGLSRNKTNQLYIAKYSCICIDSYGIRDYSFFRDHYNMTTGKEEEIEIKHPVSLIILPHDNGSVPLICGFSFCHNSDLWVCQYIEALLDNSFYIFYTYDVFILAGIIIVALVMNSVRKWSAVLIAKPLRKLCFPNCRYMLSFTAVNGPPVYVNSGNEDGMPYIYDIYLSYSEFDSYDREVARHVKSLITEADVKVFDSVEDILPGHLVDYESAEAINNSRCFVVIASQTYVNDDFKKTELVTIQDNVIARSSEPKDCMLIIKVEDCGFVGLHRVPCVHLPTGLKEKFSLDQSSINQFYKWISTTKTAKQNKTNVMTQLYASGFTINSVVFVAILLYFSAKSSIFINNTQWPEGADVVKV